MLKKDATIRRERFITIPSLPRKDVRGITSDQFSKCPLPKPANAKIKHT
ncbi:hypothetical protein THERMOT_1294 [Bathymodiolus thermophilus thioautotrophic gill symbiont]|nr:hypothetical protein THERMOT_1294 [Bathymodiolus thermophilus thioautotrophic gill symbiont]